MSEVLLREDTDGVRVLTLNRPEVRNALSSALLQALRDALLAADADDQTRAVVLTGAGTAFCSGVDLKEAAREDGGPFRRLASADAISQVGRMAKPVIGAVNGPVFTGGLELALGCDFLIASDRASFADTHARVGLLPRGGMTARLPRVVGDAWARRMSMTTQVLDAATAERIGLVTEVVPHDRLMPRVMECARAIAEVPPDTMQALKQAYEQGARTTLAPALAYEREIAARFVPDYAGLEQRRIAVTARNREQMGGQS